MVTRWPGIATGFRQRCDTHGECRIVALNATVMGASYACRIYILFVFLYIYVYDSTHVCQGGVSQSDPHQLTN